MRGVYPRHPRPTRKVVVPIGPSIGYVPLTQGQYALVDSEDAQRLGAFNWTAARDSRSKEFYAVRKGQDGRGIRMHSVVCGTTSGYITDHRNGNTLDNRISNLREVTVGQNCWNSRRSRRSSSGLKGAYWSQRTRRWRAQIMVKGKIYYLGAAHPTAESAHQAYITASTELHGEFSRA